MNPFSYLTDDNLRTVLQVEPFGHEEFYLENHDVKLQVLNYGNTHKGFLHYFFVFKNGKVLNPEGTGYSFEEIKSELYRRKVEAILK